jgi:hypothetical protein
MTSEMLAPPEEISSRDTTIMGRLAHEGVPVRVIARSFQLQAELVRETLDFSIQVGAITEMPRDDWPPTARRADRVPGAGIVPDTDLIIGAQRALGLTRLEASFMVVLLKRNEADKNTLHAVNEQQRSFRGTRPNNPDPTDPKIVDVVICKMRKKLKVKSIEIQTLWGAGYFITPEHRAIAMSLISAVGADAPGGAHGQSAA